MGLAYAFLYMGRYNLTVAKNALGKLMSKRQFGTISAVGTVTYGVSFLVNGPLVDRLGGRWGMLIGTLGALAANSAMGMVLYSNAHWGSELPLLASFTLLYAVNMYFQSFGAVSIVTVKAPWFHLNERGTFSTIFGVLISAGIYFAFDWGGAVVDATRATPARELGLTARAFGALFGLGDGRVDQNWMIFFVPAIMLGVLWAIMALSLRNTPGDAGFADFDTGEATLSADGERLPVFVAVAKILTHPVLRYVCLIEFCSGVLRNGVMHWYPIFAKETGFKYTFTITSNWGLWLLLCGLIGANSTGWVSDWLFNSRRAPMCAISYGLMIVGALVLLLGIDSANLWIAGSAALAISMAVIAVHGILSGTATADFGGRKNTGIVVGIVDGFVYLGTGLQFLLLGVLTPEGEAAQVASNWRAWPALLIPFALAGFWMTRKIWHALPGANEH